MIEVILDWAPVAGLIVLVFSMAFNFLYNRLWWQVLVGVVLHGCAIVWWIGGGGEPDAVALFALLYFIVFAAIGVSLAVHAIRLPRFIWSLNAKASEANKQE